MRDFIWLENAYLVQTATACQHKRKTSHKIDVEVLLDAISQSSNLAPTCDRPVTSQPHSPVTSLARSACAAPCYTCIGNFAASLMGSINPNWVSKRELHQCLLNWLEEMKPRLMKGRSLQVARDAAEEALSQGLLMIYGEKEGVKDPQWMTSRNRGSYLFVVAKNKATLLRKKKWQLLVHDDEFNIESPESLTRDFSFNALHAAVSKLPIDYRFVVEMYYFQDVSILGISEQLGTSVYRVRLQLERAREQLQSLIENLGA